jgi:seryl-tRNA synthetase
MEDTEKVKTIIRSWIDLDDECRKLQKRQKEIREEKSKLSENILSFMRDNHVDNFTLEGSGMGTLSRSMRTSKPPLRRELIKTQLLLQFADQPNRVAEALRAIEGGEENITQRELLSRRVPRKTVNLT